MALDLGAGSEQHAQPARAILGGLKVSEVTAFVLMPAVDHLIHRSQEYGSDMRQTPYREERI